MSYQDDRDETKYVSLGRVTVIRMKEKSFRVILHDYEKIRTWVPRSLIADEDAFDDEGNCHGEMFVKEFWYLREKDAGRFTDPDFHSSAKHQDNWRSQPDGRRHSHE